MGTIVVATDDLMMRSRVEESARALNLAVHVARPGDDLAAAIETTKPNLLIVDLARPDVVEEIRKIKNHPSHRSIPLIAFGSHVEADLLETAGMAGCDEVLPRSAFAKKLPGILSGIIGRHGDLGNGEPSPRGTQGAQEKKCSVVKSVPRTPPEDEVRSVRSGAGLFDLARHALLEIRGKDRAGFLHNMTTNDVKGLRPGMGNASTMVSRQGKMIAEFRVRSLDDSLLLEMVPELGPVVLQALGKFIVTEDVTLHDAATRRSLFALEGPHAAAILREIFALDFTTLEEFHFLPCPWNGATVIVSRHDRVGEPGFDFIAPPEGLPTLSRAILDAGATTCGMEALEILRVESGNPRWGVDMDTDHLPMEAGLEAKTISYAKGCYVGQEVIQRVKTYSEPPRLLVGFILDGERPARRGDPIRFGEAEVGKVTSAIFSPTLGKPIALGCVRKEAKDDGRVVEIVNASGPIRAVVTSPPFPRR